MSVIVRYPTDIDDRPYWTGEREYCWSSRQRDAKRFASVEAARKAWAPGGDCITPLYVKLVPTLRRRILMILERHDTSTPKGSRGALKEIREAVAKRPRRWVRS